MQKLLFKFSHFFLFLFSSIRIFLLFVLKPLNGLCLCLKIHFEVISFFLGSDRRREYNEPTAVDRAAALLFQSAVRCWLKVLQHLENAIEVFVEKSLFACRISRVSVWQTLLKGGVMSTGKAEVIYYLVPYFPSHFLVMIPLISRKKLVCSC